MSTWSLLDQKLLSRAVYVIFQNPLLFCPADFFPFLLSDSKGLVSSVGTYQVALVAKVMQKPFYALAESYKFLRHYPLSQTDLPIPASSDRPSIPLEFPSTIPDTHSIPGFLSRGSSLTPQSRSPQAPATPPHGIDGGGGGGGGGVDGGRKYERMEMTKEMEAINPMVDVTTPDLIDFIITDLGAPLSPTSVSQYLVAQFSS